MASTAPSPIASDFLVVGEGSGDASFISHLCTARDIPGFQVEDARGESKFVTHIKGLKSRKGYGQLKGLLVVSDNDESPQANFGKIRNYLRDAKVPYPDTVLTPARRDEIAVVVMMLPFTLAGGPVRGCLETLLLQSLEDRQPGLKICVDAFSACMPERRTRNQEDKLRCRCFVAAMYAEDPNLALSWVVSPTKGLIDLSHSCFDEIVAFLRGFPGLCEPRRR
jgi:hypothetical protein